MSDIEREAFESHHYIPEGAEWNEKLRLYRCISSLTVNHPINDSWETWQEAIQWQAARQAPASGEVEPVEGEPLPCPFCGNQPDFMPHPDPTYPQIQCRNIECPIGIVGDEVSLESWNERAYTHPPAKVPEEMIALVAICQALRGYVDERALELYCENSVVYHFLDALRSAESITESATPRLMEDE